LQETGGREPGKSEGGTDEDKNMEVLDLNAQLIPHELGQTNANALLSADM